MKPEDRKRLKQHIEMIVDHKMPAELSSIGKIKRALTVARLADVGCELSRFDVIELNGFIADMEEDSALATHELAAYQLRIRELEKRVAVNKDNPCLHIDKDVTNTNPDYYNHDETSTDNNKGESND